MKILCMQLTSMQMWWVTSLELEFDNGRYVPFSHSQEGGHGGEIRGNDKCNSPGPLLVSTTLPTDAYRQEQEWLQQEQEND